MTEDEAKTKWCPFSRVMNIKGEGGGNRWDHSVKDAYAPNGSLCIGSECMAWKYVGTVNEIIRGKGVCSLMSNAR